MNVRLALAPLTVGAIIFNACGSNSGDKAASTTTSSRAAVTSSPTTATTATPAPANTSAPTTAASGTGPPTAAAVDVMLSEWKIESGPIKSGTVTFNAHNTGRFPHELRVFKGTVAELPRLADGSVNEDALAAGALIGKVDRLEAGTTAAATLNLVPGRYALVCNLVAAGQSHAAKGQVLDVTVS